MTASFLAVGVVIGGGVIAGVSSPEDVFFTAIQQPETREIVFESNNHLLSIESLGGPLYLACFGSDRIPPLGLLDIQFVLYDISSKAILNTFTIESTEFYRVDISPTGDLFTIVHGHDSVGSLVFAKSGEILYNIPYSEDVTLKATGRDLVAIADYNPTRHGRAYNMSGLVYGPMPLPGPFVACDFAASGIPGADHLRGDLVYLDREVAVYEYWRGGQRCITAYNSSCASNWSFVSETQLAFKEYGRLNGRMTFLVSNLNGKAALIDAITGDVISSFASEMAAAVFGEDELFFASTAGVKDLTGRLVFHISRFNETAGLQSSIESYGSMCPETIHVTNGVLSATYPPSEEADSTETALYSSKLTSALLLPGVWTVCGANEESIKLIGGTTRDGVLSVITLDKSLLNQ
jgi:hypothetical protein